MKEESNPYALSPEAVKVLVEGHERREAELRRQLRIIEVLIAAGFLSRDKYEEARALVENLQ